jgi:protein-tyrosine phosphatase
MPQILVICTANICRSPLVQAYIAREAAQRGLTDWTVTSAGTWAENERPAARYSRRVAADRDLDIEDHRSRMVTGAMLEEADLVLCMTASHAEALSVEFPQQASKIFLLSEMTGRRYDISDPYGGPLSGYETMARETERLVTEGFERIVTLANQQAQLN